MIHEIIGDLLTSGADVICHQVNYHGVMSGGIAASIREKMLPTMQYAVYVDYCQRLGRNALGTVLFLHTCIDRGIIANLFSQDDFTTDYEALRFCLKNVEKAARIMSWTGALPGNMGGGIAHGDWNEVMKVINDVFEKSPVELTIVYWYANTQQVVDK